MSVIKRHTTKPTFEECTHMYVSLITYMTKAMKNQKWLIVSDKYASIPTHRHLIASDELGTPEELEALRKTPTVIVPLGAKYR